MFLIFWPEGQKEKSPNVKFWYKKMDKINVSQKYKQQSHSVIK